MRPVYDMLQAAAKRTSGHMPGHKGKAPFGEVDLYALDTTELPVTDDLYAPERGLLEAQRLYARAAGAGASLLLHNGSTVGIHAMVQRWAREGDTVLLPRNAHLSAVNGCVLGGLKVRWIPLRQRGDGYCYVAAEDVLMAMERHPEAKALLLTRPDFYGGCLPMKAIVEKACAMQIRVVVDEAHGAHLPWSDAVQSAGALGVDAWTQSVHKTAPGLTACAVLHLRDAGDKPHALRLLRRVQTSSPSFLLMLAIDDARAWMVQNGRGRLLAATEAVNRARMLLKGTPYRDAHDGWRETGYAFDPTRLAIDAPQGGRALNEALAARGIDMEMADDRRVVAIVTAMDDDESIARLTDALRMIPARTVDALAPLDIPPMPVRRMEVRPAAMAACEWVPLERAEGRVAAQSAGLYPPGVPLVCPGEEISGDVISLLNNVKNRERFGMEGDCLLCVQNDV